LIRGGLLFEKQNRVLDLQALLFDFSQFLFFTGQQYFLTISPLESIKSKHLEN